MIGQTDNGLCPVLSFMVARGPGAGPLFAWEDKPFLTREAFVAAIRAALTEAANDYAGHSFRIGAATTAARHTGLANQDTGQVGECGIHQVHPNSTRYTAGGSMPTHVGHSHINEHVTSWILLNPSLLFNI